MDTLQLTGQKTLNGKLNNLKIILASVVYVISYLKIFSSIFALNYSLNNFYKGSIFGATALLNAVGKRLGYKDFIILPKYSGDSNYGLFLTFIAILFCILVYILIRSKIKSLIVVISFIPFVIAFIYGLEYSSFSAFALIIATFIVIFLAVDKASFETIILTVALLIGLSSLVFAFDMPSQLAGGNYPKDLKNKVESKVVTSFYGKELLGNGNLNVNRPKAEKKTALKVTMDKPQSMYLKGFTGDVLEQGQWKERGNNYYFNTYPLTKALQVKGFEGNKQLSLSSQALGDKIEENTVTVKALSADKRYAYIPYEYMGGKYLDGKRLKGDLIINNGIYTPLKEYTYKVNSASVSQWTDLGSRFFAEGLGKKEDDKRYKEFLNLESYFNQYVYDTYTKLSDEQLKTLIVNFGERPDLSKGHLDYKVAIEKVRTYLKDNFIYTEKVEGSKGNLRFSEDLLFKEKKGYDTHYATVATLMFRYYGIPARYAQGYLITPEMAAKGDATMEVSDANGHSWVEIYIDGIGFVPLEVCPRYIGKMEEPDLSIGISNDSVKSSATAGKNDNYSPDKVDKDEEKQNKDSNAPFRRIFAIILIVVGLLTLILLLWLLYKLLKKLSNVIGEKRRWKQLIEGDDYNLAAAAILAYMEKKDLDIDKETLDVGNKGAYSREIVTKEEADFMKKKLAEKIKEKRCDKKKERRKLFAKRK